MLTNRPGIQSDPAAGFTLTEVIVVVTLLMIVIAVAGQALTRMFFSQSHSVSERTAVSQVNRAWEYLASDIRAAGASGTVGTPDAFGRRTTNDPYELRSRLRSASDPQVRDIAIAAPSQLRFRADVTANPGLECVEYSVTGGRWLTRTVAGGGACDSAAAIGTWLSRTNLVSLRASTAGAASTNIFRYRVMQPPTYKFDATNSQNCTIVDRPAGTTLSTTGPAAVSAPYAEVNRAVGVSMSIDSFVDSAKVAVRTQLQHSVQLKSRLDNPVYMESMGCAARS